ncbi:MAG: rRNA (adenine1518-N6/adenine1519-N6)-dimethyltransferase [Clostridia bacterium]|nr:rRNA (adenine1518-N6/adenine1519-N6)-dimethyltransferase [Clostridia bacterium]
METLATPGKTLAKIKELGLSPRKSRGQNFLIDANIVQKIVKAADICPTDTVVEIGPGLGALTQLLAKQAKLVIAIEIDNILFTALKNIFQDAGNVNLVHGDALKVDFDELVMGFKGDDMGRLPTYKVVANLPYYITTPLIIHLLTNNFKIKELVLMVQAEVGYRMLARPGNKDFGSLSVVVQYYTEPEIVVKAPKTTFYPRPEVDSVVLKLKRRVEPLVDVENEDFFFQVVRAAFNQRRKTLLNALGRLEIERNYLLEALKKAGIDPKRRGETLEILDFANLSNVLYRQLKRR